MAFYPPGVNMAKASTGGGGGSGITGVLSKSYGAPPGGPYVLGDSYIVADPASGLWAGYEDYIATWDGSQWLFVFPTLGQLAYVADEGIYYTWNGAAWVAQTMAAHGPTHEQGATDPVPSLPTTDEKDALLGTFGVPSNTNRYVTDLDPRLGSGGGGGSGDACSGCASAAYTDGAYHTIAAVPLSRNPLIVEVRAMGRRTDAAGRGVYVRRAVVYRGVGGAAAILSTFDTPLVRESIPAWDVVLAVSGLSLLIQVKGSAGCNVDWKACWVFSSVTRGLITTDGVYSTIQTIPIPDDTVCLIEAQVVGLRADADGCSGYLHRAVIYREGGGAATIQGSVDSTLTRETVAAWDSTIQVSGNNVLVVVRGAAGQTVSWKAAHAIEELT